MGENQFEFIATTCVSDALKGLHHLDNAIKPVSDDLSVIGRAYTVNLQAGDNLLLLKGIKEARKGDVLVVDAKGYTNMASAGDFVMGLAQTLGLAGVVIDGVIRDIKGIRELNFPVFCKGSTTAASHKYGKGEINVPVSCGGTVIKPGDTIIGDADGVVCIPKGKEEEVLEAARNKEQKDIERENKVLVNEETARTYLEDLFSEK
ncbi:RraA family protein [Salirhabdus salicampi]|uniref:RraA family protein n=1 Tax=Salirhabdus salicampi TaxID=476102 RepID=UPI0020C2EC8E|nr:RraA family protein [Salirhabdus salicampi]MCP8615920.1 RraA family protein [Salirhabdus salicampi]